MRGSPISARERDEIVTDLERIAAKYFVKLSTLAKLAHAVSKERRA